MALTTPRKIQKKRGEMGRLEAIWLKTSHGGAMASASEVSSQKDKGLLGDANFGRSHRQVTFIEKEIFDAMDHRFSGLIRPEMRRANFMVKGVELRETVGRILSIGDLKVKISGETKPCKIMDEACEGLMEALNTKWRGGVFGCVLNDASVKVGDDVDWLLE